MTMAVDAPSCYVAPMSGPPESYFDTSGLGST